MISVQAGNDPDPQPLTGLRVANRRIEIHVHTST